MSIIHVNHVLICVHAMFNISGIGTYMFQNGVRLFDQCKLHQSRFIFQ